MENRFLIELKGIIRFQISKELRQIKNIERMKVNFDKLL